MDLSFLRDRKNMKVYWDSSSVRGNRKRVKEQVESVTGSSESGSESLFEASERSENNIKAV